MKCDKCGQEYKNPFFKDALGKALKIGAQVLFIPKPDSHVLSYAPVPCYIHQCDWDSVSNRWSMELQSRSTRIMYFSVNGEGGKPHECLYLLGEFE
jgi:hypothetical protein